MSLVEKWKNYIFLLISSVTLLCLMTWTKFSFELPTSLYYKVSWKADFLLNSSTMLLLLLAALVAVYFINSRLSLGTRKATAAIGLTAVMLFFFSWQVMLSLFGVGLLLYGSLYFFQKNDWLFVCFVVGALTALAIIFARLPMNRYSFLLLFGQLIFGYYSTLIDKYRGIPKIDPIHAWLLWFCFPAGLFTILYGYKMFAESFHNAPYEKIASSGVYLIAVAIFQLMITQLMQIYFFPEFSFLRSKVVSVASGNEPIYILWAYGFKILFFFIFEQIGTINLLQGITKIFGYNVDNQIDGLWRATSFLEVWRRGSYNTRMYWINYIYMPLLIKTKNIYLSDLLVWFVYGIIASIAYGGVNIYYVKPDSLQEIWITIFFKHLVLYGAVSCIEMYLNKNLLIQRSVALWKKNAVRFFLFITMYLTHVIGNEFGPNPNTTLSETVHMICRMFGFS